MHGIEPNEAVDFPDQYSHGKVGMPTCRGIPDYFIFVVNFNLLIQEADEIIINSFLFVRVLVILIILNAIFAGHSPHLLKKLINTFTLVKTFDRKIVNAAKFRPHLPGLFP
jgi:hypothetical protein